MAELAAPTESYFRAGTHSTEQENGNEQASEPLSTKHRLGEDDEEESRYSVTKKRDSKNALAQVSPSKLDISDESDANSVADFEDEEEGYEGSDDEDDIVEDKQEMQEHVIDLASLMNGTAPEVGDAPATDLSHLEDEKFKVRKIKVSHGRHSNCLNVFRTRKGKDRETKEVNNLHCCKNKPTTNMDK